MEFKEVNAARHSVRDFSDHPVAKEQLRQLVKEAQKAPSWVNSQPWRVYIATGNTLSRIKALFRKLDAEHVKGHTDLSVMSRDDWAPEPQARMKEWGHQIVAHFANYDEAHQTMTGLMTALNHTPVIVYITVPKATPEWSIFDAGLFAQNLMLAAKDQGIDSIPTYNSVRFPQQIRQIMGISNDEKLIIGIELGYPRESRVNTYRSPRENVDQILTIKD